MEILSQENLRKDQKDAVRKRAASRAEKTLALYQAGVEKPMQVNYAKALAKMQTDTSASLTEAISLFENYLDYKDARQRIAACEAKLLALREAEEKARIETEKKEEEELREAARIQAEKETQKEARRKKIKKTGIISSAVIVAAIAIALVLTKVIIPSSKYNKAVSLFESGQYEDSPS